MKKRILSIALALTLILVLVPSAATAQHITVNPTPSTVFVDGEAVEFRAYLIGGNNFFMLRALAYVLNGTSAQFNVGWDGATNTITLTSGQAYEIVGGETALGDGLPKTATPTTARVMLDGQELNLTAYLIGGNNFFRLRDVMQALNVGVIWDGPANAIRIDTSIGYDEAEDIPTPQGGAGNVAVGSIIPFGGYDWRVLDVQGYRMLVLSEYIIAFQSYYHELVAVTWAESSIRHWLNNDFLSSFSESERNMIAETTVINNDNPWHGTPGGADTVDRVFLLSLEEIVRYFGDSEQLQNRPGAEWLMISDQYDTNRVAYVAIERDGRDGQPAWWWLRSPGDVSSNAAGVNYKGVLWVFGHFVDSNRGGIRPAMWIYL